MPFETVLWQGRVSQFRTSINCEQQVLPTSHNRHPPPPPLHPCTRCIFFFLQCLVAWQGGQSIHTSPSAHVADCGSLLQSAGFSLPTVDQDTVQVGYPNAFVLMEHLQARFVKVAPCVCAIVEFSVFRFQAQPTYV